MKKSVHFVSIHSFVHSTVNLQPALSPSQPLAAEHLPLKTVAAAAAPPPRFDCCPFSSNFVGGKLASISLFLSSMPLDELKKIIKKKKKKKTHFLKLNYILKKRVFFFK